MKIHELDCSLNLLDRLGGYGVEYNNDRLEVKCSTPEERSRMAGILTSVGFAVDSSYDKNTRSWTIYSVGQLEPT